MKCKNTECENEVKPNRTYCSLTCRNVYVNKHLRSYDKFKLTYKQRRDKKIEEYLLNPTTCKVCDSIIEYDKRTAKYCSHQCSMVETNPTLLYTEQKRLQVNKAIQSGHRRRPNVGPYKIICKGCQCEFVYHLRKKKYCSDKCRKNFSQKHLSEKQKYKSLAHFKFALNQYPNEFDFSLIEKYGWYKAKNRGDNLNGVSRDHKYSIDEGFRNNVDPLLLAHPANCRLIRHNDNVSKGGKSLITLEQLLIDIEDFDKRNKKMLVT